MKSSQSQPNNRREDVAPDQKGLIPTDAPGRPEVGARGLSHRPHLLRAPPARLAEQERSPDPVPESSGDDSSGASNGAYDEQTVAIKHVESPSGAGKGQYQTQSPVEEQVAKLREAVNAKLLLQQRMRGSYGQKRMSPVSEEEITNVSPLNATFASPPAGLRTTSTLSTDSTESTGSSKTVRASVPATPAAGVPLRTPSYPFPYVPGTPRSWSTAFHQPFTSLSPTVAAPSGMQDTPGKASTVTSGGSTPAADNSMFMPQNAGRQAQDDPRFPTPNLYDLVLQLNSEPGMEAWWTTVTNIMHDHFKADRTTLVMPADPSDIENVPWGQKATFSMNGPEEFVPHRLVAEQAAQSHVQRPEFSVREPSSELFSDIRPQKLHPERLRPRLEARHSYAGHGQNRDLPTEPNARPNVRPAGPQRTVTHASGLPGSIGPGRIPVRRLPSSSGSYRHTSLTDPDFSSIAGGVDAGPYAEVFPTLRALDHEASPLIEAGGVNRVLERGKVVTVTREYGPDSSGSSNSNGSVSAALSETSTAQPTPGATSQSFAARTFGNYRSVFAPDNGPEGRRDYEEYEQFPTSPWAQSPAPSPAIRADEEENPFFASEEQQVEESFNDTGTPKDYSQYNQVEAIGVDKANTVIHIPLIHPTISQPMQSLRTSHSKDRPGQPQRSNTIDTTRKAPVAILSVLSSTVPYPHNLTQTLKLLGPHLATSCAIAQQFSMTHLQAVNIRHRRTASGHMTGNAPMTIEPTTLDELVNAELEEAPGSMGGSITSPSDYSGRSKHSPASSLVGTPGWDPAAQGWTSSKSVTGTPAHTGTEIVDNYFDSKKRHAQRTSSNASASMQNTPAKQIKNLGSQDSRSSGKRPSPPGDDDSRIPRSERKLYTRSSMKEERSPLRLGPGKDHSPTRTSDSPNSPQKGSMRQALTTGFTDFHDRQHSYLHSYGADFQSSFGSVPTTTGDGKAAALSSHNRKTSYPEHMPPPSERLLRTIIDSLPVQIFTAEPETGKLTWVNSKFLIYRGQDSQQVLSEPWQAIHPNDRVEYMETWNRSLRTGQQLQQKVRLQRFDGSYRWFYVRAAPLKDKRQHIVHWIGTNMDFHEQHIAETNSARQQETAASEAKYRALANSSPQVVFAVNRVKGVTFCNSQWLNYSGQTEAQALGAGFMDHVHPDDLMKCKLPTFEEGSSQPKNVPTSLPPEPRRTVSTSVASSSGSSETEKGVSSSDPSSSPITNMPQRKLSELANTGILKVSRDADGRPSYSTEVRLKSRDGDFRWHLVRVLLAEPTLKGGDEEETWYGTCTDINDHKTLERDLKETMDEKSRFLSNMSHEIRTPLNGITGMVNFLIDSSLTAEQMEHVNIIRASTEGLRGLINDILDLSKAEAGMIALNMDWVYVRAIIEEVNDLTSAMAIDKGLELNYLVEENVPPQIKGDRFRIRQILLNVIGNAIKFTQKGEVFVRCSIHRDFEYPLAKGETLIKFEIVDTGSGFTDKEADLLFKRFSQIDGSSTRQHGGTGLGLVISRQLAHLHGGDMSAKGIPGKGSTFMFFIKTVLPTKDDMPPAPPPTPGVGTIPILPFSPGPVTTPTPMPRLTKTPSITMPPEVMAKPSPKFLSEYASSPSPYASPDLPRDSPALSSTSSEPSVRSAARTSSIRSERSSVSSFDPSSYSSSPMKLAMPTEPKLDRTESTSSVSATSSQDSSKTVRKLPKPAEMSVISPGGGLSGMLPPMYSILVICPLQYSREATVEHIDKTLPKNVPHQITARGSLLDCQKMLGGDDPVIFTHVVAVLQDVGEITALLDQVLTSPTHTSTTMIIITDLAQKRAIIEQAPKHDYKKLEDNGRLRFVFKPLKPSRFAIIFDPQKEREMSTDRNQDSAQQVATSQKQVFEELTKRLGNRDKRVLLVEDNRVNQMVILKFFSKIATRVETVMDGVQCTDKVFANPHGHYSIILVSFHASAVDKSEC